MTMKAHTYYIILGRPPIGGKLPPFSAPWRRHCLLSIVCAGCVDSICSSDHKPVFASFDVGVVTQFTSSHGASVLIVLQDICVEVLYDTIRYEMLF